MIVNFWLKVAAGTVFGRRWNGIRSPLERYSVAAGTVFGAPLLWARQLRYGSGKVGDYVNTYLVCLLW